MVSYSFSLCDLGQVTEEPLEAPVRSVKKMKLIMLAAREPGETMGFLERLSVWVGFTCSLFL